MSETLILQNKKVDSKQEDELMTRAAGIMMALSTIDRGLSEMVDRELVSTDEVSDLLLDVRQFLTGSEPSQPTTD